ncbi:MFS transporter [Streptomyces sp. 1222.5]|uniref:MFS transporter n=1 Tax=Streptomyces sp. 1222.5 TaxID=1881026 RepID=UPI003D727C52
MPPAPPSPRPWPTSSPAPTGYAPSRSTTGPSTSASRSPPPWGGALSTHGYLILFYGDAIAQLLCAAIVFLRLPETRPEHTGQRGEPSGSADTKAAVPRARINLGTVFRDGPFVSLVGLAFLLTMVFGMGQIALPVVMGRQGYPATQFGLVFAVNGILVVLAQIPTTRMIRRRGRTGMIITASLLFGFGMALSGLANSMAFYACTVAVWTVGEIIWMPVSQALVAELSPPHGRGRYQGVFSMARQASFLLASLTAGVMLSTWGPDSVWCTCALLGLLSAAGYLALSRGRSGRRLEAARHAAAAQHSGTDSGTDPSITAAGAASPRGSGRRATAGETPVPPITAP